MSVQSEAASRHHEPPEPSVHATIPTWLLRAPNVSPGAKVLYLHLSSIFEGGPIEVCTFPVLNGGPGLLSDFAGAAGDDAVSRWLLELEGVGIATVEEMGPCPEHIGASHFAVGFDLYRRA